MEDDVNPLVVHSGIAEKGALALAHQHDSGEVFQAGGESNGVLKVIRAIVKCADETVSFIGDEKIEITEIVIGPHGVDGAVEARAEPAESLPFDLGAAAEIPPGKSTTAGEAREKKPGALGIGARRAKKFRSRNVIGEKPVAGTAGVPGVDRRKHQDRIRGGWGCAHGQMPAPCMTHLMSLCQAGSR